MTRKHGHGQPWKYRYKVLEVRPHAVRLQVPKDGSVPEVAEWQLIRRCEPAPEERHDPRPDDPTLTEMGVPLTSAPPGAANVEADTHDPDELFEIDKILDATKRGGKYYITVKWKGYADPTEEPRARLLEDANDELRRDIEVAVRRYQEGARLAHDDDDDDPTTSTTTTSDEPETATQGPAVLTSHHGRPVRSRAQTIRYTPSVNAVVANFPPLVTLFEDHVLQL